MSANGARFASRPVAAGGTPVEDWLAWGREFPTLELDGCPALVVVSPHPDDETLGLGATMATLQARGVPVQVVSVSDGGGAYPALSPLERRWLERDRRAELHRVTAALGLKPPICLGLTDGELAASERELTTHLDGILGQFAPGTWCAATWRGDGHPDHEAVGRAARDAALRAGAMALEYPVWMWHWARPNDPDVPWHRCVELPVDRAALARKQHAIKLFRSQLDGAEFEPILPPFVVRRALAVGEVLFR